MLHLLLCLGVGQCAEYRRVCYYTNWAQYRPSFGKFQPRNIPLHLCSHLVYAFASMSGNRLRPFEWNDETVPWMRGMYVGQLSLLSLTVPALLAYWLRLRPAVVTYVGQQVWSHMASNIAWFCHGVSNQKLIIALTFLNFLIKQAKLCMYNSFRNEPLSLYILTNILGVPKVGQAY